MPSKLAAPAPATNTKPVVSPTSAGSGIPQTGSSMPPTKEAMAAAAKSSKVVAQRESKANTYIAIVAVITVLVVVVCGFIAKSLIGSIITDSQLIIKQNTANNDLSTKLQNIPQLINNYNSLSNKQQLIADALPSNPDFPQLVSIAQAMSLDSGVTLKSVAPTANSGTGSTTATPTPGSSVGAQPYQFNVQVEGTYGQVVQFFKDIELSARPIKVLSTQLTGDGTALQADISLQTYYEGPATINDQTEPLQ